MKKILLMIVAVTLVGCGKKEAQPPKVVPNSPKTKARIEKAIRNHLKKSEFEPLTKADLSKVTELNVSNGTFADLSVLGQFTNLERLILMGNSVTDLSPGARLKQLEYLHLYKNRITDISPLVGLKQLKNLRLAHNPNLTFAQLDKLQKALPNCRIHHNAKKPLDPLLRGK